MQVFASSDLEGAGSGDDTLVLDCVDNWSEAVFDGISGLGNGVVVWTFNQNSAWEGVLHTFDESVLLLSKRLFVDNLGETKVSFGDTVEGVDLFAATCERNSLTVSLFATTDANNASLS